MDQSRQQLINGSNNFILYKRRWYVLATVAILNMSSGIQCVCIAPVAYTAAEFYNKDVFVINLMTIISLLVMTPSGIFATWFLDTFGLRASLILGACFNSSGWVIIIVSALPGTSNDVRVHLLYLGYVMVAFALPFLLYAPTKMSALWFPQNQRAIANTIAAICNSLGIMAAGIFSPMLCPRKDKFLYMLFIEGLPGLLGVMMASVGVCNSKPPSPPSASADTPSEPYLIGLKALLKNKDYWLLAFAIGGGIGLFNALVSLLTQILCPWGYDDRFSGTICFASLLGAGLVGCMIIGCIVEYTKKYIEVTKICYAMALIAIIAFSVMHNVRDVAPFIAISLATVGFFGLPLYPIGNELAVETTYPVGEATSSGIVMIIGQLQSILLVVILSALGKEMRPDVSGEACGSGDSSYEKIYDMTLPLYFLTGYAIFVTCLFVLGFETRYKRLDEEKKANEFENARIVL